MSNNCHIYLAYLVLYLFFADIYPTWLFGLDSELRSDLKLDGNVEISYFFDFLSFLLGIRYYIPIVFALAIDPFLG